MGRSAASNDIRRTDRAHVYLSVGPTATATDKLTYLLSAKVIAQSFVFVHPRNSPTAGMVLGSSARPIHCHDANLN